MTTSKYHYSTGKRKTSIAKVRIFKGEGKITVNDKTINEFFTVKTLIGLIKSPFKLTGHVNKFDVSALVKGGGITSQAEAMRHGIARALVESDPLLRPTLKKAGMLTRDSRIKERKKYGLKRARKAPQFSKR
ncbi:MAG: 30S ribosomal protein S9 [Candidatus Peregrinibacteria bacterium]